MTPAVEIAQFLADEGVGERGGSGRWSIHVSREPTSPDDVVTLYDTGGPPPVAIDVNLRAHTIQVRVRSKDYVEGAETQNSIFTLLAQPDAVVDGLPLERSIGEHRYTGMWLTSEIMYIGRDDNDRFLFTANYEVHRQPLEGQS